MKYEIQNATRKGSVGLTKLLFHGRVISALHIYYNAHDRFIVTL